MVVVVVVLVEEEEEEEEWGDADDTEGDESAGCPAIAKL